MTQRWMGVVWAGVVVAACSGGAGGGNQGAGSDGGAFRLLSVNWPLVSLTTCGDSVAMLLRATV